MRGDGETANGNQFNSPERVVSNGSKASNGTAHDSRASNGLGSPHSNGNGVAIHGQRQPLWNGHDREELTRIMIQGLSDMGYHGAAEQLSKESGFELEGPTVAAFRGAVLGGEWAEAEALLFGIASSYEVDDLYSDGGHDTSSTSWKRPSHVKGLPLSEGANRDELKFVLREQKYLELLEKRDLGSALMVLRQELTPLHQDPNRLHALSSLIMSQSADDLRDQAQWDGADGQSRHYLLSELSKSISPSVMIPEARLANLLDQVKSGWIENCMYHNTIDSPSLYVDHHCQQEVFPSDEALVLHDHKDEVWHLAFSNNGRYLATAGKDGFVHIYDLSGEVRRIQSLPHDEAGVCYVAWSPDDRMLITGASKDNDPACRVWNVEKGEVATTLSHFDYSVASVAWCPSGMSFVLGSHDRKHGLTIWSTEEELIHRWEDVDMRVYDLALSSDGQRLVVLLQSRILVFDFVTRVKIGDYPVEHVHKVQLTCVSISKDCRTMLVSMNDDLLRLMDIDTGEIIGQFEGHKQRNFMIKSAFGGADENFVVSGSEDSKIYIWRTSGQSVVELDAHHPGCVNAVAWNPMDHQMFASAGDDHQVKIWTTEHHRLRAHGQR